MKIEVEIHENVIKRIVDETVAKSFEDNRNYGGDGIGRKRIADQVKGVIDTMDFGPAIIQSIARHVDPVVDSVVRGMIKTKVQQIMRDNSSLGPLFQKATE